jgi:hypothetical protein
MHKTLPSFVFFCSFSLILLLSLFIHLKSFGGQKVTIERLYPWILPISMSPFSSIDFHASQGTGTPHFDPFLTCR